MPASNLHFDHCWRPYHPLGLLLVGSQQPRLMQRRGREEAVHWSYASALVLQEYWAAPVEAEEGVLIAGSGHSSHWSHSCCLESKARAPVVWHLVQVAKGPFFL